MAEENEKHSQGKGVVVTIGSGGKPVDRRLSFLPGLERIARESGETITVKQLPEDGEEDDGNPIEINPQPKPSKN